MRHWLDPAPVQVPPALAAAVGGHPLVAETLVRRGIASAEAARAFLDPAAYTPAPPTDLPGLERTAERLERALRQGEPIAVWGDFDVDGQTATTLLVETLRDLGGRVTYYIPVRERESHGVHLPRLSQLIEAGAQVVLTCDTGIAAHEAAAYARGRGVDFLITDHHELPLTLPEAYTVVNPHLLPEGHPLSTLPGVGVAYELAAALYARAGRPEAADRLLDLVALGIVADVATLAGDVRYLLQRGLAALRTTARLGLQELFRLAEVVPAQLTEEHIGFVLGPRLNALGRLSDANSAVEFLTTPDLARARILAGELEKLNAQRQWLVAQVTKAALAQLEREPALLELPVLVLAHPEWPGGIVGIVAARLAERYQRPAILIAAPPGQPGRGSARSVPGCDITAALAANADLLQGFGGHEAAAGLAIDPERIPELRRALARTVQGQCGDLAEPAPRAVDGYLKLNELSLALVDDLERLAPFGPGNPPLTLGVRDLALRSYSALGRTQEHRMLMVEDSAGQTQRVVWWQSAAWPLPEGRFDLACTVRASNYRGQRELQVQWVEARPLAVPVLTPPPPALEVTDYREEAEPLTVLAQLSPPYQLWREGDLSGPPPGTPRQALQPAPALVVWTVPPGPAEFRAALQAVQPQRVYLFGRPAGVTDLESFLKRLAGLVKYALANTAGQVELTTLAAALAHRESTVRQGLEWLAARGHLTIAGEQAGKVTLAAGTGVPTSALPRIATQLQALLDETAAYRAYFAAAEAAALVVNVKAEELRGP